MKLIHRTERSVDSSLVDFMPTIERDPKVVFISNRVVLKVHRHQYANRSLHIGTENLGVDYMGHVLPKRSPLLQPFNLM